MRRFARSWDIVLFSVVLLAASVPLALWGAPPLQFAYSPMAVAKGEWWRLLSHPFVHVSRYHLLLDGVAVVSLLLGLSDRRSSDRILLVVASAATSLSAASLLPGETATYGLCGLSGVGHGLMAGAAVFSLREEDAAGRRTAAIILCVVVAKSLIEAVTGRLLFDLVHLGDLGRPNPLCHLGGVVGGVLTALALPAVRRGLASPNDPIVSNRLFVPGCPPTYDSSHPGALQGPDDALPTELRGVRLQV